MARGFRCVLLLAMALALSASNQPDVKGGGKQTATENAVSSSLQDIAASYDQASKRAESTEKQEAECGPEKYASNTNLCAQWKAADAAANSAWWAWAGFLLGFGSLIGVIAALGIALHSNWIARDTAKRQLRAYITVRKPRLSQHPVVGAILEFAVEAVNCGQTPAKDVKWKAMFAYVPDEDRDAILNQFDPDVLLSYSVIGANDPAIRSGKLPKPLTEDDAKRLSDGTAQIYAFGVIEYKDIFLTDQKTIYRAFYTSDHGFVWDDKGCDAT